MKIENGYEIELQLKTMPIFAAEFTRRLIARVSGDEAFTGVLLAGSAIGDKMDEWSDLDFVIICRQSQYLNVMRTTRNFVASLGKLLSAFTGEHVGEPRLLICLYDSPLLHVDVKFVTIDDLDHRVEDPIILFDRNSEIKERLNESIACWPKRDIDWFEERAWIWLHYGLAKIGRGEWFEANGMLGFFREQVLGPMIATTQERNQRGVRYMEGVEEWYARLTGTIGGIKRAELLDAYENSATLYGDLRNILEPNVVNRAAEIAVSNFLKKIRNDV